MAFLEIFSSAATFSFNVVHEIRVTTPLHISYLYLEYERYHETSIKRCREREPTRLTTYHTPVSVYSQYSLEELLYPRAV
jgi:hypothetical protein